MQNAVFNIADERQDCWLLRCNERVMLAVLQTSETRTAYCAASRVGEVTGSLRQMGT